MLLGPGSSLPLYCPDDRIPLPDCPIYVCNTPLFVLCFYCYWEEDPTPNSRDISFLLARPYFVKS